MQRNCWQLLCGCKGTKKNAHIQIKERECAENLHFASKMIENRLSDGAMDEKKEVTLLRM